MPVPPPIVLLTHEFAPFRGGAATYVREIAEAATRCGIAVEVWAPDRGAACDDSEYSFPVSRLRCSGKLGIRVAGFILALGRERRRLKGRQVVLLSVGAHMAWAALSEVGIVSAKEATAFFHGSEVLKFSGSRVWRPAVRRLYQSVCGYAAATQYVRDLVRSSSLTNRSLPLVLAPCAVPAGLQRWPISLPESDGCRLLTVARLHPRKGQVEMVQALARLSAEYRSRLCYRMVGAGTEEYRREIEREGKAGGIRCEFLGDVPQGKLGESYSWCDIYVQSSQTKPDSVEGFGISYLEAAFFGRPSVGVQTGGVGEAVKDGVTGILVPEGDADALAAAVQRLMDSRELRKRMGEAGREYAAAFSWEASARALLNRGESAPPTPTAMPRLPE